MIIKTIKVKKLGIIIAACVVSALFIFLVVYGVAKAYSDDCITLDTEELRQEFIKDLGWETDSEYTSSKVVKIPVEFDDVYEDYNEIQEQQGFNLEKYKGKEVEIYTYLVKNYPNDKENVYLSLIIFEGRLIGGDVSCNELDGFMQGLKKAD
ncbi:MAG: DUF4830 domain-containing protein [Ruminococcus sp.]|nr:DUF4830 domain-containing protein [Ruminococcus sp.]